MKWKKKITTLLVAVLLSFTVSTAAYAHDVPNLEQDGSITVSMTYNGRSVSGGTLTMYRTGDVAEDDGNYSFVLSEAFAGSQASLADIQSDELAQKLAAYAEDRGISGETVRVDEAGTAVFRNVEPGLYLIVQGEAAKGYQAAVPFLVSVPMVKDGTYLYDVDASPKTELKKAPPTPVPTKPVSSRLPQTGQLNWPIPILTAAGLALGIAGWRLRTGKGKERHAN